MASTAPDVIARTAAMLPQHDGVQALSRLVHEADYGEAACSAVVFPNGKKHLAAALLERVEEEVGEDRVVEARDEVAALVDGVMMADVDLRLAVKLLGGRRLQKQELRADSYDGQIALGRWGEIEGDKAAADIARAVAGLGDLGLGDLMHNTHCAAGGGVTSADPSFGMVELQARACAGDRTLSLSRGVRLFSSAGSAEQRSGGAH
eukprot:5883158-Pleurochrysis_carterae.AAC.1